MVPPSQSSRQSARLRRTNERWIADLLATGPVKDMALADLRAAVVAGLRRAFPQAAGRGTQIEDAAQDALLLITDRVHTFRGDSSFLTWAMAIAMRTMLSQLRRAHWKDVSLDAMVEAGRVPSVAADPSQGHHLDWARLLEVVRTAVDQDLTDRQRQAVRAELAGVPPGVIAERMGSNRNAVYKLLHDARLRLRDAIVDAGWTDASVRSILSDVDANG